VLNTIRLSDGTLLRLNDEGDVRESSGGHTVRNAAIGAAVGAVIGAVIGGGKGAAIGAAGGGVGGVILSRGHEQLDVPRGAEVTLTAVSPYRAP
jgi:outer membrane lipoprotein SlyB